MTQQQNMKSGQKKDRKRSAEILGVFARHNFYTNGFTPEELRTTLEDLGPTYVKIGQIMSSRTDLLPKRYCRELEKLRSNVKPLEASDARAMIEQEMGKTIDEIYSEFRDQPLGSASIAQAHYGVLKDGTRVVTKVQRPGIAAMMREDFVLLKKLAGMINMTAEGDEDSESIDLLGILIELEKVTEEELNFQVEAENTRLFRELCIEDDSAVSCPRIIDSLTTERILTMTYVDGYSLSHRDRVERDGYDRLEIGKALLNNYLHQVLDAGFFHGDPHQGNIMLSSGVPYWIDFGMVGRISQSGISSIQNLIFALVQEDVEALTNAALALGTVNGKINKTRLMDDLEAISTKYMSSKNLMDGSPNVLLAVLLAKAVRRMDPDNDKTVIIGVAVNHKAILGNHESFHALSDVAYLDFPKDRENEDLDKLCTVARGQLMLQAQPENSMNYIKGMQSGSEMMSWVPLPIKSAMVDVAMSFLSMGTACVSYTNSRSFGPLDPHIQEVFVLAEAATFGVVVEIACINGSFCLLFAQSFLSEVYFEAFMQELEGAGIPVEILRKDQCPLSGVRFDGIENEKQDILKEILTGLFPPSENR